MFEIYFFAFIKITLKNNLIITKQSYSSTNTLLSKTEYVYNLDNKVLKVYHIIIYLEHQNKLFKLMIMIIFEMLFLKQMLNENTTNYTYDEFNNLIQTQDIKWNKTLNIYDKSNNLIKKQIIQSNNKTSTTNYTYDKDNKIIISNKCFK